MTTAQDLHARMVAVETRIAQCRTRLADLDEAQRFGIGAALESFSLAMDHEEKAGR